ncbi:MAG: PASTA domain-containing protein [Ilumatobacter sp.]
MENDDEKESATDGGGLVGAVLAGRYRVARVASTGANTVILDAVDLERDGAVTLKVVRPEHAGDEEFRRKFRRLAEISQALTHPNIASVQDWGEIDLRGESTVFWTVDALGGGSLRDLLDRGRMLEPGQALVVGLEACRALDAAHQRGLFHTELTPSKMVFGADRRLRVVDFGMARLLAEPAWAASASVPTHVARYASPEQALGLPIDAKTDVYALALVMLEAVTGEVPFSADSTVATLSGRVDKLMPVSADLGPLASVLERAGRPESSDRFTAAEFGRALVQAAPKLPKPDPIPVLSSGMFDTTAMRRPTDPTGGVERPAPAPALAHVDEEGVASAGDPSPTSERAINVAADPLLAGAIVAAGAGPEDREAVTADAVDDDVVTADAADTAHVTATSGGETDRDVDVPEADIVAVDEDQPDPDPDPDLDTENDPDTALARVGAGPSASPEEGVDRVVADTAPRAVSATAVQPVIPAVASSPVVDSSPLYDDAPARRRRGPIAILVLLLLLGLGALAYAGSLLLQTKSFEVPVLAGTPEDEAMNQIVGNDWEVSTRGERSDSFPEPDTVIRTSPGPGAVLDEGSPFLLVLSEGPEFRTLPELADLPVAAAVQRLADLRLEATEEPQRVFSETVVDGNVVSWRVSGDANGDMQAGAQILPGEVVVLTVSMGPEPRSVPDLSKTTLTDAIAIADALQLEVIEGDSVFSETVPEGQIVSQTPSSGASIEREGAITVQVSLGPDIVEFPDLEGLSFTDAQTVLAEAGFVVGNLLGSTDGVFVEASVEGVDVVAGAEFRRGQAIDLIFL